MSARRGHADLTPGCTECALDDVRAEVSRLNALGKQRCEEIQRLHRLLAQSEADWTVFRQEYDKAKVEIERLTKMLDVCSSVHGHNVKLHEERKQLREALRTVAERQREACAKRIETLQGEWFEENAQWVRETPLVTEGET